MTARPSDLFRDGESLEAFWWRRLREHFRDHKPASVLDREAYQRQQKAKSTGAGFTEKTVDPQAGSKS